MQRVLTHERGQASGLREIEEWWSIDDLLDAHIALDVVDEIARRAQERARNEAET